MTAIARAKPYSIRRSGIHGRGVFANGRIRKGTVIIEYKGKRSSWDEALTRPDSDPGDPAHTFLFDLSDGRVMDARIRGNAARWINHSCDPNCLTFEDADGRVFVEAKRFTLYAAAVNMPLRSLPKSRLVFMSQVLPAPLGGSQCSKFARFACIAPQASH